jgi:diaminohydroxyphosphoribosylaminopyrimidine deaminase/5-amino-6-(5-phosphoribosylamino)uracil reductase
LMQEEAAAANYQFLFAHQRRRPLVVVKSAMSIDGRIALPSGESQWITGHEARSEGHRLRAELGAVLVGRRTVERDDPSLTARLDGVVNQPVRIVLDPHAKLARSMKVFNADAQTIHVTGPIELNALLQDLFARGITGLLVEGGPTTVANFVGENLVDRYELFMAPKLLGQGLCWLDKPLSSTLAGAPSLEFRQVRRLGSDLWITAAPV